MSRVKLKPEDIFSGVLTDLVKMEKETPNDMKLGEKVRAYLKMLVA